MAPAVPISAEFAGNEPSISLPFPSMTVSQRALFLVGIVSGSTWFTLFALRWLQLHYRPETRNGQDTDAIERSKAASTAEKFFCLVSQLFAVLFLVYLCETHALPDQPREYSRDAYFFILAVIVTFCVFQRQTTASGRPLTEGERSKTNAETEEKGTKLLHRFQTEEWRGWMQIFFVLYHAFAAVEVYNVIRVFVGCYVWMTGYGNFLYYSRTKDLSISRIFKSLFRLNAFALVLCVAAKTPYLLYYIVFMHTIYFLYVTAFFLIVPSANSSDSGLQYKLGVAVVLTFVLFDVGTVFSTLSSFLPLSKGDIHEIEFRLRLDHFACLWGMVFAFNLKQTREDISKLESLSRIKRVFIGAVVVCCLGMGTFAWGSTLRENKVDYNSSHPHRFIFPVLLYVFLRNSVPQLRSVFIRPFAFVGKMTLEIYLCQFHLLMKQDATSLISIIPGYPLLNFFCILFPYILCSFVVFEVVSKLRDFVCGSHIVVTARNMACCLLVAGISGCIAVIFQASQEFLLWSLIVCLLGAVCCITIVHRQRVSESVSGQWIADVWHYLGAAENVASGKSNDVESAGANISTENALPLEADSGRQNSNLPSLNTFLLRWALLCGIALIGVGMIAAVSTLSARSSIAREQCDHAGSRGQWKTEEKISSYESTIRNDSHSTVIRWEFTEDVAVGCRFRAWNARSANALMERALSPGLPMLFIGDSHARYTYLAMMRLLNGSSVVHHIPFGRHKDFETRLEGKQGVYLFRPYISEVIEEIEALRTGITPAGREDNITATGVLGNLTDSSRALIFLSFSQWDLVYRRDDRAFLTATHRLSELVASFPPLVTIVIANTPQVYVPMLSDHKKAKLSEELMHKYGHLVAQAAGGSNSFVLDAMTMSDALREYSPDGVHMPLEFYNAAAQTALNELEAHLTRQLKRVKQRSIYNLPHLGILTAGLLLFQIFSRDNFFVLRHLVACLSRPQASS